MQVCIHDSWSVCISAQPACVPISAHLPASVTDAFAYTAGFGPVWKFSMSLCVDSCKCLRSGRISRVHITPKLLRTLVLEMADVLEAEGQYPGEQRLSSSLGQPGLWGTAALA